MSSALVGSGGKIDTVEDVRDLLKFLSGYSGLSTRITDQCREGVNVVNKNIAVGPKGSTLRNSPIATPTSGTRNSPGQWMWAVDIVPSLQHIANTLSVLQQQGYTTVIEATVRNNSGDIEFLYRFHK